MSKGLFKIFSFYKNKRVTLALLFFIILGNLLFAPTVSSIPPTPNWPPPPTPEEIEEVKDSAAETPGVIEKIAMLPVTLPLNSVRIVAWALKQVTFGFFQLTKWFLHWILGPNFMKINGSPISYTNPDHNPIIETGILFVCQPVDVVKLATSAYADAIHPNVNYVDKEMVNQARLNDLKVRVWNADDEKTLSKMISLGVDAIGTNRPDILLRMLNRI